MYLPGAAEMDGSANHKSSLASASPFALRTTSSYWEQAVGSMTWERATDVIGSESPSCK
jgi:hypothetical protein